MRRKNLFAVIMAATLLAPGAVFANDADAADEPDQQTGSLAPVLADIEFDPLAPRSPVIDSPLVQAILAEHPGHEIVLCLAGCPRTKHAIIWQRPMPAYAAAVTGGVSLTSNRQDEPQAMAESADDAVTCVAGCRGPVGVVVFRGMRLAWIGKDKGEMLESSLAELGRRLAASLSEEAQTTPRAWIGRSATDSLLSAFTGAPAPRATVSPAPKHVAAKSQPNG